MTAIKFSGRGQSLVKLIFTWLCAQSTTLYMPLKNAMLCDSKGLEADNGAVVDIRETTTGHINQI